VSKKDEKWKKIARMMQEKGLFARIVNNYTFLREEGNRLNERWKRIRPFRIFAVFLGVVALIMISQFPQHAISLERQQEQLEAAASAYYEAQSENNRLNAELSEIDTRDFIERTARREYGYCWYGETIYEVGNLEEFQETLEFEVYGAE